VYGSECRYDFPHVRFLVFVRNGGRNRRLPRLPGALRESRPRDADGLIVRKPPEFVKKNCPRSGEFQRSINLLTAPLEGEKRR